MHEGDSGWQKGGREVETWVEGAGMEVALL